MLVLTRKQGQEIVVPGANIRITVLGTKGTTVRLGISAPRDVSVYRREVWDRVCPAMDAIAKIDSDPPTTVQCKVLPR